MFHHNTHVSPNGNTSLIDLALLSDTNDLNHCCTIPPLSNSDHLGITISLKWIANTKHYSKFRCVWLYGNADFNKACHIINATDWNSIITDEINKSTEHWTEKFLSIMEECIPRANIKPRKYLPWITTNIIRHMRKRNNTFRKAKRTQKSKHLLKYKKLRNLHSASNKTFWKTMKLLKKNQVTIPSLQHDNIEAKSDKEKTDMLSNFFSKCWNDMDPPLSDSVATDTLYGVFPNNVTYDLEDLLCTEEEVLHLLQGLNVEKANGSDNISSRMLKETARSIAPSIAKLFNQSITSGKFPNLWKRARVVTLVPTTL